METLIQDVRYGLRVLAKSPVFTAVAVVSLALGIGANTAIFSLVDTILLKSLPVKDPQELVRIGVTSNSKRAEPRVIPYPMFHELRRSSEVFRGVLTEGYDGMSFRESGKTDVTERVMGEWVSGNYFSLLGVHAFLGRVFSEQDDKTPIHRVAILSYGFWKRRLGGDFTVIGSTIYLNGDAYTVVGVTPPGYFGLEVGFSPDVRVPMGEGGSDQTWARLKPGVSMQQAEAATEVLYQQMLQENPELKSNPRYGTQHIELLPGERGSSGLRRQFEEPLFILMTIVGIVLCVACINISNLLLSRSAARQKEVAVRLAVGASRLRLVRQLLTEGVLLSLFGGFAGLLVAHWGTDLLFSFLPQDTTPIVLELHPDIRMLVFNFCIAVITGILFALAPAIRSTRCDLIPLLKSDASTYGHKPHRFELRKALVVFQVALSLSLLVVATLFVRTLTNLEAVDSATSTDKILIFSMKHVRERYTPDQIARFYEELIRRVEVLPGVRSASLAAGIRSSVLSSRGGGVSVHLGQEQFNGDRSTHVDEVSPMFFRTMSTPLLMGRDFSFADKGESSKVAIINERFVHYFFGNQNPIGRRIGISELAGEDLEIVGVVGDTRYVNLREPPRRVVYLPLLQYPARQNIYALHVLAAGAPNELISAIRKEFQFLDKDLPVFSIKTFAKLVDESLAQERLLATLSGFFSLLTLLLASIGLYGVVAYGVSRRTRELGIRMALGAQRHQVLWLVLRETLGLVAIGIATGLAATFLTTRLIKSHLFGIAPTDLTAVVLATVVLGAVAVSAGYFPARRATKVDPMVALRHE